MLSSSPAPSSSGGNGAQDLLLVRAALQGDRAAIDQVLGRLSCIVRFVYRLNRSLGYDLPPDGLEDVAQQVYAALWPRLPDFAGSAALESWAYGFCRNCLRAEARRRSPNARVVSDGIDLGERLGDEPTPAELAFRAEGLDLLRDELDRLSPVEREVVVLRHVEGWSFERIAGHQGLPPSTIKDRCYKALTKMRGRLQRRDVSA